MHGAVDSDTGALILTVDVEGLDELVQLLRHAKPSSMPLTPVPERLSTRPITSLNLALNADDAVTIAINDDVATITGSPSGFARLAREVRQFGDYNDLSEPGMHAHFDPGSRSVAGGVLAQSSDPFIVAGPVPDEAGHDR